VPHARTQSTVCLYLVKSIDRGNIPGNIPAPFWYQFITQARSACPNDGGTDEDELDTDDGRGGHVGHGGRRDDAPGCADAHGQDAESDREIMLVKADALTVGFSVRLEARPGRETDLEAFLRGAAPLEPMERTSRTANHTIVAGSA
jgi:hypothetical protein